MSASVQCPACHTPLPPGNRPRCRACGRKRPAAVKPPPPSAPRRVSAPLPAAVPPGAASRRRLALVLGTAVAVGLLLPACWLGTRARPRTGGVEPAPAPATAMDAGAIPSPVVEASPLADSLPPAPPLLPDDRVAAALSPKDPPPDPAAGEDRKPEAAPPPPAAPPLAPAKASPGRRSTLAEDDLRKQLVTAPEVGLPRAGRSALVRSYQADFASSAGLSARFHFDPTLLLRHYPQAGVLPLRPAPDCQLGEKEAATLGVLAQKLHTYLDLIAPKDANGKRAKPTLLRQALRQERRGKRPEWLRVEALPTMLQILMAEDVPLRLMLVDFLSEIDAKRATVALAQRAVFDLSPEVRQAALDALRDRPRADYRPILVDALRYPWPAAADHAADALVALDDQEAAPLLVALLAKPDPAAPYAVGKKGMSVHHLVGINHRANCLLCHPPAVSSDDPVVGVDPFTTLPAGSGAGGGGGWGGGGGGGGGKPAGRSRGPALLVRADVQFLRQDFSVAFPVGLPGAAVEGVRFDYLVCTRPLTSAEVRAWKQLPPPDPTAYPQREATLFALRALTGKDVGPTTEAWRQLFPNADAEAEGVRLSAALLRASPAQRDQLLIRWRDAKDDGTTAGLACALSHLTGALQGRARTVLVERLARLPADQLRARLQDEDDELRHAAALACVRKADQELVPDLIGLLLALEPEVAAGAHQNLQRLTGKDFGPPADAGQAERSAAAAEWQAWWRDQTAP
jgi:HEAT repeat protein